MSPLPLARRYAPSQPALHWPTLSLSANILDSGHRGDGDSPTVTVTITVTEWRTTPQPTPTSLTNSLAGMSRDALATSTGPPLIHCPTSEMLAYPTASATSGPSPESTLRSGLVAGAVAGALAGITFVIIAALVYVVHRKQKCGRAAHRDGNAGCTGRSERPSIDSTEVQRTREHMVRPYSISCAAPPPSYDAIDYPETAVQTQIQIPAPEPAHLTKGASVAASHRDVVYMHMPSPSDESWTPSTAASRETIYTYTSAATGSA